MDVYSFGILCLWLLFSKQLSQKIPHEIVGEGGFIEFSPPNVHQGKNALSDLKSGDLLPKLANYLIETDRDLDDTQKDNLKMFFISCLVKDPERRSSRIRQLLFLIDPGVKVADISPIVKQGAASVHEDFQVS